MSSYKELAEHFDAWHTTPEGAFALRREQLLFQRLLSSWPRRGHRLLLAGCASGFFLEMFWEEGFDVTGLEGSPELLEAARDRLGGRAELQLGQPDHLPFDDASFDYVVLTSALNCTGGNLHLAKNMILEASRVAARGILMGVINRWSLFALQGGIPDSAQLQGMDIWNFIRMTRICCPEYRCTMRSILPFPASTWKETAFLRRCNDIIFPVPVGAYIGMRVDRQPRIPLTPLWLTVGSQMKKGQQESCTVCAMQQKRKHSEELQN